MATNDTEKDFRVNMLNSFLLTPHRQKEVFKAMHEEFIKKDPSCYAHLGAWYVDNQSIRDHKELFTAYLITNDFSQDYRNSGLSILRDMPPYQVARVVRYVKEVIKKSPTSLKTEVTRYLRERESNTSWFDSVVLNARKHLKYLYATFRISPGGPEVNIEYKGKPITTSYADAILFKGVYPDISMLPVLAQISNSKDESHKAQLIVKHNIPFRVVVGLVKKVTPIVMVAMLNNMSAQDVINNLGVFKKHGFMANEATKELILDRIDEAKTDSRVHTLKTKVAADSSDVGEDISKALSDVADVRVKDRGEITRPTAILVDKSGSMEKAIEVGKSVASIVSTIATSDIYVYAFDETARKVESEGTELSDWTEAFSCIYAGSGTSVGAGMRRLMNENEYVETVILVTDERENRAPLFVDAYNKYCETLNVKPTVVIIRVDSNPNTIYTRVYDSCISANIDVSRYVFNGDYYSLEDIIPLLQQPTSAELLEQIMEYPLPQRRDA